MQFWFCLIIGPSASYLDECTADVWTNYFITFSTRWNFFFSRDLFADVISEHNRNLYNKLSCARILIGSHLWYIGGQTYSNRSQRTWDGRTWVTHSAAPRVPLFCSYHILTSSVIYFWTDARQLGIYLLNEARSRNWIWSDKFTSYVIIVLEKIYSSLFISNYTRNRVITYTN